MRRSKVKVSFTIDIFFRKELNFKDKAKVQKSSTNKSRFFIDMRMCLLLMIIMVQKREMHY